MAPVRQSINDAVLVSLQTALAESNLETLHQYITPETHLDISAFWTRANQANDSNNGVAACKAVSQVLVKIDGERGFAASGVAFIRRVLSDHAKSIFRNLSSARPIYVNPTLRMLLTMAQFDAGVLGNEVYVTMDFKTFKALPKLLVGSGPQRQQPAAEKVVLGKRKREEGGTKTATRSLFVALIFTLLKNAESAAKAEILQQRPIMTELVKHLDNDPAESIAKTLKGLITVLDSRDIARPAKINFFNEWTLSQLLKLYRNSDSDDPDTLLIRTQTQAFFYKVTTVQDQGICFASHGLKPPSTKKLYNPILAGFTSSLRPVDDVLHGELLLSILTSSTELIVPWLQSCSFNFSPRLEVEWIKSMRFIEQILTIPLPTHSQTELDDIPDYILLELMLPTQVAKIMTKALQHESDLVKLMALRTFSQSLRNARKLTAGNTNCANELIQSFQRRIPLIEILVPLANIPITADAAEELELLREESLVIIAAYLELFDDLPSFDFVSILNSIMMSTDKQQKGSDTLEPNSAMTFASTSEKNVVLSMARHIEGIQWLTKKKGMKSFFVVVVQYILSLGEEDQESYKHAIDTLEDVITKDSFMFFDSPAPVAKVEACIRACNACKLPEEEKLVVDFMEECMIRFQAAPYKYWDRLVELLPDTMTCIESAISPILVVFQEQLDFVSNSTLVKAWLAQTAANLLSIGELELALSAVIDFTPTDFVTSISVSKWNAVTWINRLGRTPKIDDIWTVLPSMLAQLPPGERLDLKSYLVTRSLAVIHQLELSDTVLQLLQLVKDTTNISDYSDIPELQALVKILLLRLHPSTLVPSGLLPESMALELLQEITSSAATCTDSAVSACLSCLRTKSILTSSDTQGLTRKEFCQTDLVLSTLTEAIRAGSVEQFNLASLFASLNQVTIKQHIMVQFISTFLSCFQAKESDIDSRMFEWLEKIDFITLAPITASALKSDGLEIREIGHRLLGSFKLDSDNIENICNSSEPAIFECLEVLARSDANLASLLFTTLLPRMTEVTNLDTVNMNLLKVVVQGVDLDRDEVKQGLLAFHRGIGLLLTKKFAEERAEEGKSLSEDTVASVRVFSDYVLQMPRFAVDCGPKMLQTMAEAALENQSYQNDVLHLLAAIISSTKTQAFNYTRTIQDFLSKSESVMAAETKTRAVELLHALIMYDASQTNPIVLDEILRYYRGTNSADDHLLYDCLCASETALKISIGSRFKSWRLVESYNDADDDSKTLSAIISSELALDTIMHYSDHETVRVTNSKITYDQRFILPLIGAFIQSDESVTMMKQLIEHHAVGLVFMGLASQIRSIRQHASFLLSRVYRIILSSTIKEKAELETIFGLVRDSISTSLIDEQPIPRIQAVFLALATHILLNPAHYLYEKINRFLLARPTLDLLDIPLFLNLFNSHDNYVKDISWLLRLLAAGIVDGCEREYKRRHVLEMCMGLYRSRTANVKVKEGILEILSRTLQCPGMRWYFEKVGGFAWLEMGNESELDILRGR